MICKHYRIWLLTNSKSHFLSLTRFQPHHTLFSLLGRLSSFPSLGCFLAYFWCLKHSFPWLSWCSSHYWTQMSVTEHPLRRRWGKKQPVARKTRLRKTSPELSHHRGLHSLSCLGSWLGSEKQISTPGSPAAAWWEDGKSNQVNRNIEEILSTTCLRNYNLWENWSLPGKSN